MRLGLTLVLCLRLNLVLCLRLTWVLTQMLTRMLTLGTHLGSALRGHPDRKRRCTVLWTLARG